MKKIISLIITLVAIVAGAQGADNRTKIHVVQATSTDMIPVVGNQIKLPSFTITNGVPACFAMHIYMWEKKVDGEWTSTISGKFTEGTWRYGCYVEIDSKTDPDNQYVLAGDVKVYVNGVEWDIEHSYVHDDESYVTVRSPEITLFRETVYKVEATSTDLATIPELGWPIKQPTITVTTGAPAYFNINELNGWWQKKVNGEWKYVREGNFTEGTWRFYTQVRIDKRTDPNNQYVLSENVKVKVNGEEWEIISYNDADNCSWIDVLSPEVTIDSRRKVYQVKGTSADLTTIPDVGNSVKTKPTITVTTGEPAYFYIDENNGWWQKYVDGEWKSVPNGNFDEGHWRFFTSVRIDDTTDPDNQYALSENTKVYVNGTAWEKQSVNIGAGYSIMGVASPEIFVYSRKKITQVEGTSTDLKTLPEIGKPVTTKPTITVTTGAPAFFNINELNGGWQKLVDGKWTYVTGGDFTEGTWRFCCQVRIDSSTDPDNQYALVKDTKVYVNGVEWEKKVYIFDDTFSYIFVASPESSISKNRVTQVEGSSTDLTTIPVVGEPVTTKPTITVTTLAPAYFNINEYNGWWQKKVDGEWKYVREGNFTEGTWRLKCQVRIDKKTDPNNQYVLSENVKVKVNGKEWAKENYGCGDEFSYQYVTSPEIKIEFADSRTKISSVQGTSSDFASIPVLGRPLTKPTITVESGAPAYFNIDNENGWWQKRIDGEWQDVKSGNFSEGTWRFMCEVRIDETTDPDNQYVLSQNLKVRVNGTVWGQKEVIVDYNKSSVVVYSLGIELKQGLVRTQIDLAEGYSPNLMTTPRMGRSVTTKPTITVTNGVPAYFKIDEFNGNWQKKIDGEWQTVEEGEFDAGTWRFRCQVRVDSSTDPDNQYVLSDDLLVKVNGTMWGRQNVYVGDTYSYAFVTSPTIEVEEMDGFAWYGSDGTVKVETGLGNGEEAFWYVRNDDYFGGSSYVEWDCEDMPSEYPEDELVLQFGGLSGTAVLNGSNPEQDPFVDIYFNVAGEFDVADATAWEGIAIAYSCDVAPILELGLGDEMDSYMDYARPQVQLQPSTNSIVLVRIPWKDFVQPDWYMGEYQMSGSEAAQQLATVRFKVQGATEGRYHFNIVAVGSYNLPNVDNLPEPGPEKCATPTISYTGGKLKFACETEDVQFNYNVTDDDIKSDIGEEIDFTVTYTISVYASKEGFYDSDVATGTLCWIEQHPDVEGILDEDAVTEVKSLPVLIQTQGGIISIQGTAEGTPIAIYGVDGKEYGSANAEKDRTTIATSLQPGSVAVVKIGEKAVKVLVK